jgi:predicted RNase H-like HicB family nuclease
MKNQPFKYLTKIYWSEENESYIGEVPALKGCVAHGETYEEAAHELASAIRGWLTVAKKHHDPIPEPDRTMEEIQRLSPILNLAKLAKLAGINQHTLASKLRRGSKFTPAQSLRIVHALGEI